jgi:hypothetical protein
MAYETATEIIASACVEIGLQSVADPYASLAAEQIQLRGLLNQCGRELYAAHQWQQFVKTDTIDTGVSPPADGKYALASDFGYFINQTGWSPSSSGIGLPLGGPLTRQQYAYLVGTGLESSTIYISFNVNQGEMEVLPAPAPASVDITYHYMSNAWVDVLGAGTTFATKAVNASDIIQFEPILISKMLVARYKTAKGLPAQASTQEFQAMFAQFTGVNQPAPVLNMAVGYDFPYINPWTNVPQSGFGS